MGVDGVGEGFLRPNRGFAGVGGFERRAGADGPREEDRRLRHEDARGFGRDESGVEGGGDATDFGLDSLFSSDDLSPETIDALGDLFKDLGFDIDGTDSSEGTDSTDAGGSTDSTDSTDSSDSTDSTDATDDGTPPAQDRELYDELMDFINQWTGDDTGDTGSSDGSTGGTSGTGDASGGTGGSGRTDGTGGTDATGGTGTGETGGTGGTGKTDDTSETGGTSNTEETGGVQGGGATGDRQSRIDQVRSALSPEARDAFDRLGSKLDDVDLKTGKTLLDNLADMQAKGVDGQMQANGLSGNQMLSQLVQEIDNPGLIHQGDRGTCAATSVEYLMATQHPSEFARLVGGLSNGGQADTASGGQPLVRDPGSLPQDSSDRSDLDRMVQTSLMDQSELGDYDNNSDTHADGTQGLTQEDVTGLVNNLTNGKDGNFETRYANGPDVISRIQQAADAGHAVPVGLEWNAGGQHAQHELLVTKIEGDKVYLRNPWGKDENGTTFNGPARRVLDGSGDIVMSLSQFQQSLQMSSLPS